MYTKMAKSTPFEGAPKITSPGVHGASPNKPILYRVPVLGERPMKITATGLPEGLTINEKGIFSGMIAVDGNYTVHVRAENRLGVDEMDITFEILLDNVLRAPLMGFTSWNAFRMDVTQEDMLRTARIIDESGLAEYGFAYINTDSSWQDRHDFNLGYVTPNHKFPDMKAMCDEIHARGFKAGIYSTPFLSAWGAIDTEAYTGCTTGVPDYRWPTVCNRGFGVDRHEKTNVKFWCECGFDYLKYDFAPGDPYNTDLMKQELIASPRDFGFCVTVCAVPQYWQYWRQFCSSWRDGADSHACWRGVLDCVGQKDRWLEFMQRGHYYDLDMLETGVGAAWPVNELTEDEQITAYSVRIIFPSPIQISSQLDKMSEFEMNLYGNEEIIAVNQDPLFLAATPVIEDNTGDWRLKVYSKKLADGSIAYGIFNFGEVDVHWSLPEDTPSTATIRDLWAKEDSTDRRFDLKPHCCRMIKVKA